MPAAAIVGGSLISGGLGALSASKAAKAQKKGADASIAEQRRQYDQSRTDMLPWLESGKSALTDLNALASGDTSKFFADPGYNFARTEGMRGIEQSAAARGGAASGNALKALSEFNQGLASQQYGDFYNRTAARAGVGQSTSNSLANLGQNYASGVGQAYQQAGDARASGVMGTANSLANAANTGLNLWLANRGGYFNNNSGSPYNWGGGLGRTPPIRDPNQSSNSYVNTFYRP